MRLRLLVALGILMLPGSASAELVTISFDAPRSCSDLCGLVIPDASYIEDGFAFTPTLGHYDLGDYMNIDTYAGSHATLQVTSINGEFDFLGFDVVNLRFSSDGPASWDEIASVRSSAGGYYLLQPGMTRPIAFDDALWSNVSWVEFDIIDPNRDTGQDSFSFDNVRVSVPEPSSVLLLLCGLWLLTWRQWGPANPQTRHRGGSR
jgi:hypothetical protein